MSKIVIIGNGIAGITAARHIRKQGDDEILVISGETEFFFSRTALMYIYMGHMKFEHTKPYEDWFWKKNRIQIKKAWCTDIDVSNQCISTESGEKIDFDRLILALGSKPNKFGWPGQEAKGVSGMYSYQDLENIENYTQDIERGVIVGGGLIGIELAEMLYSRGIPTTFLVREKSFWRGVLPEEESEMINQEILDHHIDLQLGTELKEILMDQQGRANSVMTSDDKEIKAQFVGLTAGVSANLDLLSNTEIETNRGVLVDEYLRTNVENIYAIGDCAELRQPSLGRRAQEQVWYTGRMMGEAVAKTVVGTPTRYQPGVWFNSAKFFNIEYQTYGTVSSKIKDREEHFVWQSEDKKRLIRIVFDQTSLKVIGLNTMGIRMRHEVWEDWITSGVSISEVLRDLEKANFDPEFFKKFEFEIRSSFNCQFPDQAIENNRPSFLKRVFT